MAQLGGVHLACEQASNLLTKVLEWGRLMAYLEQSTRYVAYDSRLSSGRYRYYRDPEILDSAFGARYVGDMDRLFDGYADLLPIMQSWLTRRFPRSADDTDFVYRQSINAKALDSLRGMLPAASVSNVGIYGTGQSYEQLILRMRSHPLPEARHYAEMMLVELRKVIPSFLQRLDRPDRGGEWAAYLASTRSATEQLVERLWPDPSEAMTGDPPLVRLVDHDPDGEDKVLAAMCFSSSTLSDDELLRRVERMSSDEKAAIARAYVGERTNRRHRPGRALERTSYRFEIVSDYGAFRDLQTAPDVDGRMAGADSGSRLRVARADRRGGPGGPVRRFDDPVRRSLQGPPAGLCREGAVRALSGPPPSVRARHERQRGDAPDRAQKRHPGPSGLPARRAGDASPDRRAGRSPHPRRRDDLRRLHGSGLGADRGRATCQPQAGGDGTRSH